MCSFAEEIVDLGTLNSCAIHSKHLILYGWGTQGKEKVKSIYMCEFVKNLEMFKKEQEWRWIAKPYNTLSVNCLLKQLMLNNIVCTWGIDNGFTRFTGILSEIN